MGGTDLGPPDLPVEQKTEQVTVLDFVGEIRSAKLVTPGGQDDVTLSKGKGGGKFSR